jgi:hypothetical protein
MTVSAEPARVFWHRELPPSDADPLEVHTITANSVRVPGTIAGRDQLWFRCYDSLMAEAGARLQQELERLKGHYAHVYDESIDVRHDAASGEAWLRGRFDYVLYRRPTPSPAG